MWLVKYKCEAKHQGNISNLSLVCVSSTSISRSFGFTYLLQQSTGTILKNSDLQVQTDRVRERLEQQCSQSPSYDWFLPTVVPNRECYKFTLGGDDIIIGGDLRLGRTTGDGVGGIGLGEGDMTMGESFGDVMGGLMAIFGDGILDILCKQRKSDWS